MGTNYYLSTACHSYRCEEVLHIGKSSMGWVFALHVEPSNKEFPQGLFDWLFLMAHPLSAIRDEYNKSWSLSEMLSCITDRGRESPSLEFDYESNGAQLGPNNLVRSEIGGDCIGHGEGTWDLIQGDFS